MLHEQLANFGIMWLRARTPAEVSVCRSKKTKPFAVYGSRHAALPPAGFNLVGGI